MNPYRRWSVTLCRQSLSTWRQHPWWWSAPPLHAPPCSPSTRTRESSPAAAAPVVQIPWKLVASHHRRWDLMIQRESFLFHFFLFCTETDHFMEGGCGLQDNCFIFQKHLLPPRLLCSFSSFFFQCILSQFVLLFEESSVLASSVLYIMNQEIVLLCYQLEPQSVFLSSFPTPVTTGDIKDEVICESK